MRFSAGDEHEYILEQIWSGVNIPTGQDDDTTGDVFVAQTSRTYTGQDGVETLT